MTRSVAGSRLAARESDAGGSDAGAGRSARVMRAWMPWLFLSVAVICGGSRR